MLTNAQAESLVANVKKYGFEGKIGKHTTNGVERIVVHVNDRRDFADIKEREHRFWTARAERDLNGLRMPAITIHSIHEWDMIRPLLTRQQFEEQQDAKRKSFAKNKGKQSQESVEAVAA